MPVVPVSPGPTETVAPARPVYQTGAGDAGAFGAYSAQGEAAVGKTLETVGESIGNVAANLAIQADQRFVKDQTTASMLYADKLAYQGDGTDANPKGFFAMRGEQALKYAPTYKAALLDYQKSQTEGMSTRQANLFTSAMQGHMLQQMGQADRFSMQQSMEADKTSSAARMQAATSSAMNGSNDPVTIDSNAKIIRGEVASRPEMQGADATTLAEATKKELGDYYTKVISNRLAAGDATTAAGLFERYKDQMDPESQVRLANHLKGPVTRARGNAAANELLGMSTTVGDGDSTPGVVSPGGSGPRGMRNNNPLNLQYLNGQGASGSDGRFGVYPTMEGGIAANTKQLLRNQDTHGLTTINQMISGVVNGVDTKHGWSPDADPLNGKGQAARYAAAVAKSIGIGPDEPLNLSKSDPDKMARLITAMSKVENGGKVPEPDAVKRGVSQAFGGAAVVPVSTSGSPAAAAVDEASSPEANARVAAATKVHPDFGAAKEKALERYSDDPDMLNATLAAISKRQSAYTLSTKTEQTALRKQLPDLQAALQDGKDGVHAADYEQRVRHAFEPATADDLMGKLREAEEFGQTYRTTREMTPEQYQEARTDLVNSLSGTQLPGKAGKNVTPTDGTAPSPEAGVTGYAQRKKELAVLDATYAKAQGELKADPAAYAMSLPDVAGAFQGATDPQSTAAAIEKSQAVQRSLGIDQPRAISNRQVGTIVDQLHSAPEDQDSRALLKKLGDQYGTAWPSVFHDLVQHGHLSPQYQALGAMDTPEQAGAAANLQRALKAQATKGDKFGSGVPAAEKPGLTAGVESALSGFQESTKYGGGELFTSVVKPAVTTLAMYYAEQGQSGSDAAARAYKEIVTTKYDIDGSLRVPKMWQGKPLGAGAVRDAGATLQSRLTQDDLEPGITPRQARQGVWATNPDGAGVTLLAAKMGSYVAVRDKSGKPISFGFGAMPTATEATAAVPPGAGGL